MADLVRQIDAATAAQTKLKAAQDAMNQAVGFGSAQVARGIESLILDGTRLNDVAANLLRSTARQGLQAALTGAGPFAALFGTQGQNGATGGIFGALAKAFSGAGAVRASRASSPTAARSAPASGASWARRAPRSWPGPPP